MAIVQKIIPCLWFDGQAEEAARFYVGAFERGRIQRITRYTEAGREQHRREPGTVLTVEFELDGCALTALNGGPEFKFTEAVSLQVMCETQAEIDRLWERLSAGGDPSAQQCGWLKDRYGLSWQIVPAALLGLIADADATRSGRAMTAMMSMKKLDIAALQRSFDGT
ncbi:MAG: VOC family protein [Myxococcaceae bacterium]|nr:MAG: VOC family protein [Myxococcaceae bacterium]